MFRLSITSKFVGVVTTLFVLAAVIFATFLPRQQRIAAEQSIEEKGRSVARMLAHRSAAPLLFGDQESVANGLSSLSKIDQIGYALVVGLEGEVIATYKDPPMQILQNSGELMQDSTERLFKDTQLPMWHLSTPIISSNEQVGNLVLGLDLNELNNRVRQSRLIAIGIAFSLLVAGVLAFYLMARHIVEPIRILEEASLKVARGDIDVQVQINTGDETERLAASFNKMVGNLQALIKREYDNASAIEQLARQDIDKIQRELNLTKQKWMEGSQLLLVSLEKLANGDTNYLLPERTDELGTLFRQYNEMVLKIQSTYQELGIFKKTIATNYISASMMSRFSEPDSKEGFESQSMTENEKLIDYNDPFILSLIQDSDDGEGV